MNRIAYLWLTRGFMLAAIIVCLSLARPAHAQAGYYTYTLNQAPFNFFSSSGTASGYFDYDPTTGQFGSFDITTTDGTDMFGTPLSGSVYDNADAEGEGTLFGGTALEFANTYGGAFVVDFQTPTASPSSMETVEIQEGSGSVGASSSFNQSRAGLGDTVTVAPAGGASAVPELSPAAAVGLLSLLGVGALGRAAVKRHKQL